MPPKNLKLETYTDDDYVAMVMDRLSTNPERYRVKSGPVIQRVKDRRRYYVCTEPTQFVQSQPTQVLFDLLRYARPNDALHVRNKNYYHHRFDELDREYSDCKIWPVKYLVKYQNPQQRENPVKIGSLNDLKEAIPKGYRIHPCQVNAKLPEDGGPVYYHMSDGRHRLMASDALQFSNIPVVINWGGLHVPTLVDLGLLPDLPRV